MSAAPGLRAAWRPVSEELARWSAAGRQAQLWLRDDDAVAVTPALARLAALCADHGVPCLLAAIPARAGADLAAFVAERPLLAAATHGYTHADHASAGEKRSEFPASRPLADAERDIERARGRMTALFGAALVPVFVPPWNRIAAHAAALLPRHGYRALSAFGSAPAAAGPAPLREVNTHVDIFNSRTRRSRERDLLVALLAGELARARTAGPDRAAIGILGHHLVHDAAAWSFLEQLLAVTAADRAVRWCAAADLVR